MKVVVREDLHDPELSPTWFKTREDVARELYNTADNDYRDNVLAWYDSDETELRIANGPDMFDTWQKEGHTDAVGMPR